MIESRFLWGLFCCFRRYGGANLAGLVGSPCQVTEEKMSGRVGSILVGRYDGVTMSVRARPGCQDGKVGRLGQYVR
jgi:hypothetical protein